MITGLLKYKEKNCVFKLMEFDLEIEEIENRDEIYINDLDFFLNPDSILKDGINLLKGIEFENGKEILFNIYSLDQSGPKTHNAKLLSYIVFDQKESKFDGLQINADELNWFHSVSNSYSHRITPSTGQAEVIVKPYENTSKEFNFSFEDQKINGNLNISRTISLGSTLPLKLRTDLNFYFKATNCFHIVEKLSYITTQFLSLITYRRNCRINRITLKKKDNNTGKYRNVGKLMIRNINNMDKHSEEEKIVRERLIDLPLIEDHIGLLFDQVITNKIYLTHIPKNSKENKVTTPSRFIMVTAGFEWQYRFLHKDEQEKEDKYKEQREEIISFLDEKIEQNTGKKKKYFKSTKSLVLRSDSTLSDKIQKALDEFDDVLEIFIKDLYLLNNIEEYKYLEIADRIQLHRNNIAHGNIDQEMDSLVILDLFILEWLYYAMVLNSIGMSRKNIMLSLNKLFNRRFAL
ncbi:hypothetical protein LCY76_09425 [Fictibacillus sp. KIGAM418]|uniref:ApeA N-terminal domain-containing protein n=1 Tax=Fictibacillus marinisediminis TaxID=2878389 RepID=A0A9X1XFX6_9BACL|nr:hypothetical protein [Fictibacillus marinisediminis]MCK6256814.1 hypothetical protein [Fictibacillus marinisediminis]